MEKSNYVGRLKSQTAEYVQRIEAANIMNYGEKEPSDLPTAAGLEKLEI